MIYHHQRQPVYQALGIRPPHRIHPHHPVRQMHRGQRRHQHMAYIPNIRIYITHNPLAAGIMPIHRCLHASFSRRLSYRGLRCLNAHRRNSHYDYRNNSRHPFIVFIASAQRAEFIVFILYIHRVLFLSQVMCISVSLQQN